MRSSNLVVLGTGGHGKVIADAAIASGWQVLGFADDDGRKRDTRVLGLPVLAIGMDELSSVARETESQVAIGIGSNTIRCGVQERLESANIRVASVIHPSATIAPSASLGIGTVVFAQVAVNADARIGRGVILNTAVSIDHDCTLGDFVHVSPGVHLGGTVRIGAGTHIGVGVSIRNNVSVGEWSIVGVGAAVVRDLPARVVSYGTPARVVRPVAD